MKFGKIKKTISFLLAFFFSFFGFLALSFLFISWLLFRRSLFRRLPFSWLLLGPAFAFSLFLLFLLLSRGLFLINFPSCALQNVFSFLWLLILIHIGLCQVVLVHPFLHRFIVFINQFSVGLLELLLFFFWHFIILFRCQRACILELKFGVFRPDFSYSFGLKPQIDSSWIFWSFLPRLRGDFSHDWWLNLKNLLRNIIGRNSNSNKLLLLIWVKIAT